MADTKKRKKETRHEYARRMEKVKAAERETAKEKEATMPASEGTAGEQAAGLGAKEGGMEGMPKQKDYATTSEWAEALRKWRARKNAKKKE